MSAPLAAIQAALEQGLRHHESGRLPEAEALYRQVLAHVPDHPDALQLLADIAQRAGKDAQAVELLRHATRINPGAHGFNQLGLALHAAGRREEAVAAFRRALAVDPAYSEAHNHLGLALQQAGRRDEAIACFQAAIACRPGNAAAFNNLGIALDALGRKREALAAYRRALALDEVAAFRANFAQCVRTSAALPGDAEFRALVARAISEAWARPADLARAAIGLLIAGPPLAPLVEGAARAWPARPAREALLGASGLEALAADGLLRAVLESFPACEIALERFLTLLRHALLEDAPGGGAPEEEATLALRCALARQCFLNDYVFAHTEAEIVCARSLRATLASALRSGTAVGAPLVAAVGAYFPLGDVPGIEALLERSWPEPVGALLEQQVAQPREEARLRAALPRLTAIDDAASRRVRAQYEENPYPRWVKLPPAETPSAGAREALAGAASGSAQRAGGLEILVAGCGTGQESIELARLHREARVLAIDLSLASLGYAERKARELGAANLEHAQADILGLGPLGRTFDVISCVGVLHHLADPLAGWRTLLSLLRPGGSMLMGLYSERGRSDVVAARAFIEEHGCTATPDGIRDARQALLACGQHAEIALRRDFFSVNECRDLLFHVEEHRFRLPDVARMIAQLGVAFAGFVAEPALLEAYRKRFPADGALADLAAWDAFEGEFPAAFSAMYVFRVRKPA